jgi:hypothetical protein
MRLHCAFALLCWFYRDPVGVTAFHHWKEPKSLGVLAVLGLKCPFAVCPAAFSKGNCLDCLPWGRIGSPRAFTHGMHAEGLS